MIGRWKRLVIPAALLFGCLALLTGLDTSTLDAPHVITLTGGQMRTGLVVVGACLWLLRGKR